MGEKLELKAEIIWNWGGKTVLFAAFEDIAEWIFTFSFNNHILISSTANTCETSVHRNNFTKKTKKMIAQKISQKLSYYELHKQISFSFIISNYSPLFFIVKITINNIYNYTNNVCVFFVSSKIWNLYENYFHNYIWISANFT